MRIKNTTIAGMLSSLAVALLTGAPLAAQVASPALPDAANILSDQFATARVCAMCHSSADSATALKDAKHRSIGPHDLWRTTMMAHSTVDPLWRAVVAAEVAATPSRKAEIEAKCLRCHAPMASVEAASAGVAPSRKEFLTGESTLASLASDGVSCTVCHQISPNELGQDASFSGHFKIGDERKIFGPHAQPFQMPMYRHTGYVPTEGKHVTESALCAACHTLFTDALAADGSATGHSLLEQGPYVEWQNSQFNDEHGTRGEHAASCQDCHVPTVDEEGGPIRTRIARNPHGWDFPPVRPRSPFGRHVFTGGNTLIPSILRTQLAAAGAEDAVARFDASIQATRQLLRQETARIEIAEVERKGQRMEVAVSVKNLTGHKLPTAYPSRRVWVRLQVEDAAGQVMFASGRFDERGRIIDGAGQILAAENVDGPPSSHFSKIDSSSQVQIYESLMADAEGTVTYSLLRGAKYHKDNRLLPLGWRIDHPRGSLTAPVATSDDGDFVAGSDVVRYVVDIVPGRGPYKIEAALFYQVLGSRYAAELLSHDVPEMRAFAELYAAADPRPELLSRAEQTIADAP